MSINHEQDNANDLATKINLDRAETGSASHATGPAASLAVDCVSTLDIDPAETGVDNMASEEYPCESSGAASAAPSGAKAPKKKKKSSGKNRRARQLITGFEDNYCDPPTTQSEFQEETHDLYHPSKPFHTRIETCTQRYRSRRRLDALRSSILDTYLNFAGVNTSAKTFNGGALDKNTIDEYNASEIADIQAVDMVNSALAGQSRKFYSTQNAQHWVVDFEGVTKGFL
jgi:hypothetical protein